MSARLVYTCDGDCGEELDAETDRFDEAKEALRQAGWRTTKEGSTWAHYCADCRPRQHWERD